jgi:hypothetical protein
MTEPDPSWSQYPCTVLELHRAATDYPEASVLEIDLRTELAPATAAHLQRMGLGDRWAVVTAYNPHGRDRDPEGNEARHARLVETVRSSGVPFLRADGRSPDASHREVGLAVALPQPDAIALAARFGQSAIFWFDGEAFWLVPAGTTAEPVRLPPVATT